MEFYFRLPCCAASARAKQPKQLKMSRLYRIGLSRKIVPIMQLSAVLLLAALSAGAATSAQSTVSFTGKDVPLEQVFAAVKKQTGYTFVYYTEALQGAHKVTIDVKGMTVEEFLEVCLKDQPLTYKVIGQTVMIAKKDVKPNSVEIGEPPVTEIKGRITNDKGEPLSGASVMVKGTQKGTVTGADGMFTLKGVNTGSVLIISYTGFAPKEAVVEKNTGFLLALQPATNPLDEAQVIAYGTTTERLNMGDITTVKGEDIQKQPVNNPLLALEARVPGLFITQSTGFSGSGVKTEIQGQNSLRAANDPFYVIDGVPYISQLLPNLGNILGNSFNGGPTVADGNPLSFIDPSSIESITVLKDADATSIYGSRAANGAILITTKKGSSGQAKVDINLQQGWGNVTRKLHLFNTPEYLEMRHEAISNDGLKVSATDYDLNGLWDTTRYTDWQKTLLGGTDHYSNFTAGVSGGTTLTQYAISGTFHRETTVFPGDFADNKGAMHFNIKSASVNQKFKFQLTGGYLFDNNLLPDVDLTPLAIKLAPVAPPLFNKDGSLNWQPNSTGTSTFINPLASLYNTYQNKTGNLVSSLLLSYQILAGLTIKANFGYTNLQTREIQLDPLIATQPENRPNAQRVAQYENIGINSWSVEPQATYKMILGKGKLEILLGTSIQQNNSNGQQTIGVGYSSDQQLSDMAAASSLYPGTVNNIVYKYNAGFSRLTYNWNDKYLVDLSARRDGSSRFGSDNQFHDFAAAGIAWIFSNENIVKNHLSFISFGKLRASYGTTGNDQIGDYQTLSLYNSIRGSGSAYQGVTGLLPSGITNPYLQWEETRKLEIGLDLGFIKDRILLNLNYNHNRSSNLLLPYTLPGFEGVSSITTNFPATIQNTGLELNLTSTNVKTRHFTWTSRLILTVPRNKLVAFPGLATSSYASSLIIGKPITIIKFFHLIGVNDTTGIYEFSSKAGPTTNPVAGTDNTVVLNAGPKYYGGFENGISYKTVQLDFLFQYTKQLGTNYYFGNLPGFYQAGEGNQPISVLNRWQYVGDKVPIQRYNSNLSLITQQNDAANSDAAFSNASYIRLKNVSISWSMPDNWSKKAGMQNLRIYVLGQNLLTITHYVGLDPETLSSITLPPLKVFTLGIQATF